MPDSSPTIGGLSNPFQSSAAAVDNNTGPFPSWDTRSQPSNDPANLLNGGAAAAGGEGPTVAPEVYATNSPATTTNRTSSIVGIDQKTLLIALLILVVGAIFISRN